LSAEHPYSTRVAEDQPIRGRPEAEQGG
jgi:hypothetical protein